jgi:uncharacterized protein DUF5063
VSNLPEESRITTFTDAAAEYSSLIEAASAMPRGRFVWSIGASLTRLYAAASVLPKPAPATTEDPVPEGRDIFGPVEELREKLGDVDLYQRIFDPYERPADPFEQTLAGDLAEVYVDVQNALAAIASNAPREDVLFDVRHSFEHHWGVHAAAALYAIHWMTHTAGEAWVDPDDAG